jgi:arylsulfatase A-like enzyme
MGAAELGAGARDRVAHIDDIGTPNFYIHYAIGWAHAMDTLYQWNEQVVTHWGGARNGTIVGWPDRIEAKGEVRHQITHCIDVGPTILGADRSIDPRSTIHRVGCPSRLRDSTSIRQARRARQVGRSPSMATGTDRRIEILSSAPEK